MSGGPRRFRSGHLDANHVAVKEAFIACACQVCDLSKVGDGCPDLLVSASRRLFLVEVKTAKGKTRQKQTEFHEVWPVLVVRDAETVPALVRWMKGRP